MEKNEKIKIVLTDSNTVKQIRPVAGTISYRRFASTELSGLIEYIKNLESSGKAQIINKIKRESISYGLHMITGEWFPSVEDSMVDMPYNTISINLGVANPTKLDINDTSEWDKGSFDLEARVLKIEKDDYLIKDWESIFNINF